MGKKTKLVHFTVIDGNREEIMELSKALNNIKDRLSIDVEFLVTNDRMKLYDMQELLLMFSRLYKQENKRVTTKLKQLKEAKKQ